MLLALPLPGSTADVISVNRICLTVTMLLTIAIVSIGSMITSMVIIVVIIVRMRRVAMRMSITISILVIVSVPLCSTLHLDSIRILRCNINGMCILKCVTVLDGRSRIDRIITVMLTVSIRIVSILIELFISITIPFLNCARIGVMVTITTSATVIVCTHTKFVCCHFRCSHCARHSHCEQGSHSQH